MFCGLDFYYITMYVRQKFECINFLLYAALLYILYIILSIITKRQTPVRTMDMVEIWTTERDLTADTRWRDIASPRLEYDVWAGGKWAFYACPPPPYIHASSKQQAASSKQQAASSKQQARTHYLNLYAVNISSYRTKRPSTALCVYSRTKISYVFQPITFYQRSSYELQKVS